MSIGTGIFLSSLLLGLIYLYVKTKDTWNWKKIFIGIISFAAILLVSILIAVYWDNFFKKSDDFNSDREYSGLIQSYQGISLGDKISNLEFKYGRLKFEGKTQGNVPIYTIEAKPNLVIYKRESSDSVSFIGIDCSNTLDSFNGIKCGTSADELLKKHGKKVKIWCPKELAKDENPYRIYDMVEFGTRFYLSKNEVSHLRIYSPDDMKNPSSLKECD